MYKKPKFLVMIVAVAILFGFSGVGIAYAQKNPITIKVAHYFDPMGGIHLVRCIEWTYKIIDDYQKDFPEVKVEQEMFKWDEIDARMMMDYIAGVSHDVNFSSPQLMPKHFLLGDFLNLTPYIEKWSEEERKDFDWSPVWWKCVKDKIQLGIPTGVHTRAVAYRRDMFKDAGFDPDAVPKDLEELVTYAKRMTKDVDGDGKTDIWGLGMYFGPSRGTIELYFAPLLWHFGGKLWDPGTKRAVFASEAGVQAAKFMYDLIYKHEVTPKWSVGGAYDDVIMRSFLADKYAMAWGWGSYWLVPLEEKGWTKGCFPAKPGGRAVVAGIFVTPTKPRAQFTNAWNLSLHKLSEHPDESFKLMEYILRPDTIRVFPDGGLQARLSAWRRPEFKTDFYQEWLDAAKYGKPMPATAHYAELADTVAVAMADILAKKAPIEPTLKKYQDEYNAKYAGE